MTDWPSGPVASMGVDNPQGSSDAWISGNTGSTQAVVSDVNIDFEIACEYHDHPWIFHGTGYFTAQLNKMTPSGWQPVGPPSTLPLGDGGSGDWYQNLKVSVKMTDPVENYQLVLHDEARITWPYNVSTDLTLYFQAVQGMGFVGDFTLDFIPLSIVYCPPGQDMTNSLSQTRDFGTQFTLGESSGFQSDTSISAKLDILGIFGEGVGFNSSQSGSNQATSGIQISHFRNTTVTADNQRAIGRAYWGPLNDVFVILVNPTFAASKRADGTMFYCMKNTSLEQILLVPSRKLLRPDNDPIASAIPADSRRKLLEIDPFITNLDLFFPIDTGADLALAANEFADPSPNNRAELLGRWWLDGGTEVGYSMGEKVELMTKYANEVKYASGVTINASAGVNYDDISLALGLAGGTTTWVGFQSSQEFDAGWATNASCFLIRNQNERDLDGIELYFDKMFSTFMFRRVRSRQTSLPGVAVGVVLGVVQGVDKIPLAAMNVSLTDEKGNELITSTRQNGSYSFFNLSPGKYTLLAGDQHKPVTVTSDTTPQNPVNVDVKATRRPIDLRQSPLWELVQTLGLRSDIVRKVVSKLPHGADLQHLAKEAHVSPETLKEWERTIVIQQRTPPKPPKKHHRDDDDDQRRHK